MELRERLNRKHQANREKARTVFANEMKFFEAIGDLCTEETKYIPEKNERMPEMYDPNKHNVYRLDNGFTVIRSKVPGNIYMQIYLTDSILGQRGALITRGYSNGKETVSYQYEDPAIEEGRICFITCGEDRIYVSAQPTIKYSSDQHTIESMRIYESKEDNMDVELMDGATMIELLKESLTEDSIVFETIIGDFEKIWVTVDRSVQPEEPAAIALREKARVIEGLTAENKAQTARIEGLTAENKAQAARIEGLAAENKAQAARIEELTARIEELTAGIKGAVAEGERRGPFDSKANRFDRVIAELSKGFTAGEIAAAGETVAMPLITKSNIVKGE